jgi:hypothetical protein
MHKISLLSLHRQFEDANIQICFNGPLSHRIIEELGLAVRRYLENETPGSEKMMDVFSVYIEQTQNVRNYARGQQTEMQNDKIYNAITLMIGREENSYVVMSGNVVNKNDLEKLTNKIDLLRSLDMAGLKALYKEQRRKPVTDNAPGAGLGLIDMARKSSQPLAYEVQEIDNKTAFFTLKAVV